LGSRAGRAALDDPYVLQDLIGHTDFKITQKYVDVSQTRKRAIMERLGSSSPHISHINEKRANRKTG